MKDSSIWKMIKRDKVSLIIIVFIILIVIYVNIYITAIITKTIDATQFIFGIWVIKDIFNNNSKLKFLLCIVAVEIALILYIKLNKPDYKSKLVEVTPDIYIPAPAGQGQYGNARFLRENEYEQTFKSFFIPKAILKRNIKEFQTDSGGFVLGKKDTPKGEIVYYLEDDLHVLAIGNTGASKTRSHVLQTIGMIGLSGESILCTDVKGEISDYTKPFLESLNYVVKIINYSEPEYSDHSNDLQVIIDHVDEDNIPAAIDATWDLTAQLVGEPKGERIWNDGEASIIAASVMAVVYDNRHGENRKYQNLPNVFYFLINMCKPVTVGQKQILPLSIYVNSLPDSHPSKGLLGVSDIAPSRTRGSFYTAAVMTLKLFTNPYIANMSSSSDFDFADLGRKKMAVFIVLPDDRKTYHPLATLMLTRANTILSKEADKNGGRLVNRVNFVEEEIGNFSKIADIDTMLSMSRSKGIRHYMFIQSFAQFEKIYEKVGEKIIRDNCSVTVYLKTGSEDTLKEISDSLHDYTIQSYSTNSNSNSTSTTIKSTGSSISLQGRKLLLPDEVKQIQRPYSLVITETHPAIMYAPDLSKWYFNKLFGMGSKKHNQKLRMQRRSMRVKHDISPEIELWGIWNVIISEIKRKQKQKQQQEMMQQMMEQMKEQLESQVTE